MRIVVKLEDEIKFTFENYNELYDWLDELITDDDLEEDLNECYELVKVPILGSMPAGTLLKKIVSEEEFNLYRNDLVNGKYDEITYELEQYGESFLYGYDLLINNEKEKSE